MERFHHYEYLQFLVNGEGQDCNLQFPCVVEVSGKEGGKSKWADSLNILSFSDFFSCVFEWSANTTTSLIVGIQV